MFDLWSNSAGYVCYVALPHQRMMFGLSRRMVMVMLRRVVCRLLRWAFKLTPYRSFNLQGSNYYALRVLRGRKADSIFHAAPRSQ